MNSYYPMSKLKQLQEWKGKFMNREEFDKLYLYKAVHCDTEEKANEFLALAVSVGYKWITKTWLINFSRWERYNKETCYKLEKGGFLVADVEFFKHDNNCQIIEYQLQPKFKKVRKMI